MHDTNARMRGLTNMSARGLTNAKMRGLLVVFVLGVGFVSGGATCARRDVTLSLPPPPPLLNDQSGLAEVIAAVNRTSSIGELSTNTATVDVISMPALPKLSATLALRKQRDFRLRASLPVVMGTGLDMGSNDDVFWFEVPENFGRVLYFARHDQYQRMLDRSILPVDPTWLADALGLVQIDPATVTKPMIRLPNGRLELTSSLPLPAGVFHRVCHIDPVAGHVTDQFLYSPNGIRIAESHASNHQFYVAQNCSLPHSVQVQLLPNAGPPLEMKIDIGSYAIGQMLSGDPNLFAMPTGAGSVVDLTQIPAASMGSVAPAAFQIPVQYQPSDSGQIQYRGLTSESR